MQQSEPSPVQQEDLAKRIQEGIAISKLDKEQRKSNAAQPNEKQDFHEVEVKQGDNVSKIYSTKPQEDNVHDKINSHLKEFGHQITMQSSQVTQLAHSQIQPKLDRREGVLMKKSPHFLQGWQERYVTLDNKILKYYLPNQRDKPFGILNFDITTFQYDEIPDNKGNVLEFKLQPKGSQKIFHFKGLQLEDTKNWARLIKQHLQDSKGFNTQLTNLQVYYRFWRTDRISETQFEEQTATGDVILFRGNSANCVLQRTFTRAEYDHVAMILKFNSGTLYFFEATGYYGVGICQWSDMVTEKWYQLYDKIAFRKLNVERNQAFLTKMQHFVNQNIGKKYSCSPTKLLKLKSTIKDVSKDQNSKEERTFFCSELVAAAYKECGLLPQEKAASQYWPGSFSQAVDLKLLNGASFSPELLIDFSSCK